VTLLKNIANI